MHSKWLCELNNFCIREQKKHHFALICKVKLAKTKVCVPERMFARTHQRESKCMSNAQAAGLVYLTHSFVFMSVFFVCWCSVSWNKLTTNIVFIFCFCCCFYWDDTLYGTDVCQVVGRKQVIVLQNAKLSRRKWFLFNIQIQIYFVMLQAPKCSPAKRRKISIKTICTNE